MQAPKIQSASVPSSVIVVKAFAGAEQKRTRRNAKVKRFILPPYGVEVIVGVGVRVRVGVGVRVGVSVAVRVGVSVGVTVLVTVGVAVFVGCAVGVGVAVLVTVGVTVFVGVAETVEVGTAESNLIGPQVCTGMFAQATEVSNRTARKTSILTIQTPARGEC